MSIKVLHLKQNDLQPYYYAEAKDSDGNAIDITSATIYCTMKAIDGALKIDRQTTGITITDGANGEFEYRWQSGDTDTVGRYEIEFEINPGSGGKFTLPAGDETAIVHIHGSLDDA